MKKQLRATALVTALLLVLTSCGSTGQPQNDTAPDTPTTQQEEGKKIKDLVIPKVLTKEIEGFNILCTQKGEDFETLTNLTDGLLEVNNAGELVPAIAEKWETTDNGLTWTFHIREGVKWVDVNGNEMADCNAQDFATGLEWILNFYKNDSVNTSMPMEMIAGAQEYYEYTKTLSEQQAKELKSGEDSKFREMVGIEIPDDYTVIYRCIAPKPYFDSLGTYASLYPAPQQLIDQLGIDGFKSMNNENM